MFSKSRALSHLSVLLLPTTRWLQYIVNSDQISFPLCKTIAFLLNKLSCHWYRYFLKSFRNTYFISILYYVRYFNYFITYKILTPWGILYPASSMSFSMNLLVENVIGYNLWNKEDILSKTKYFLIYIFINMFK